MKFLILSTLLILSSASWGRENDHLEVMLCESLYPNENQSLCLSVQLMSPTFISVDDNLEMASQMFAKKEFDLAEQFTLKARKLLGVKQ